MTLDIWLVILGAVAAGAFVVSGFWPLAVGAFLVGWGFGGVLRER